MCVDMAGYMDSPACLTECPNFSYARCQRHGPQGLYLLTSVRAHVLTTYIVVLSFSCRLSLQHFPLRDVAISISMGWSRRRWPVGPLFIFYWLCQQVTPAKSGRKICLMWMSERARAFRFNLVVKYLDFVIAIVAMRWTMDDGWWTVDGNRKESIGFPLSDHA